MMICGERDGCALLSGFWAVIRIYKYGGPGRLIYLIEDISILEETKILSIWNTR